MTIAPWKIINVELAEPMQNITLEPEYNAAYLIYRFDGIVLGYDMVEKWEFPLRASELPVRAAPKVSRAIRDILAIDPLAELPAWTPRGAASYWLGSPEIDEDALPKLAAYIATRRSRPVTVTPSIVICTRARPDQLRDTLAAIRHEIEAGVEVIVVDNGPDPQTEAAARDYPQVQYMVEPKPGANRARNAGAARASGEVIVFLDDDVRPEAGWMTPLLQCFADDRVALVCGLALPDALDTEAQIKFQFEIGFGGMGQVPLSFDRDFIDGGWKGVPVWNIGTGANMAIRKQSLIDLDGLDERLGPGALGGCGDDSEFWHRQLFAGYKAIYEPLSIVAHQHRRDTAALTKQAYGYSFGHIVALFAQYAQDGDRSDLVRAFTFYPSWLIKRTLRQPINYWYGKPDSLLGAWWRGYLSGLREIGLVFRTRPPKWKG